MDRIPLVDLRPDPELDDEIRSRLQGILAAGSFVLGEEVAAFERAFAAWVGAEHCVGTSNGSDALELVLRALGIGAGDEVIVPVNTFAATAASVLRAGATPVFVDCDPRRLLLDPAAVARARTPRTRAIVPVHLHGRVAPVATLPAEGLHVIEDASQAHGGRGGGVEDRPGDARVGTLGVAAAFSFYPAKILGAWGDAGAVVTGDPELAARIRTLRSYGRDGDRGHALLGFNCRLDAVQAAVLSAKLGRVDGWIEDRRRIAARYDEALAEVGDLVFPLRRPGDVDGYHAILLPDRDRVLAALAGAGIEAGVHYRRPLHLEPAFAAPGSGPGSFPVAEAAADRLLSLPLHPRLTDVQQDAGGGGPPGRLRAGPARLILRPPDAGSDPVPRSARPRGAPPPRGRHRRARDRCGHPRVRRPVVRDRGTRGLALPGPTTVRDRGRRAGDPARRLPPGPDPGPARRRADRTDRARPRPRGPRRRLRGLVRDLQARPAREPPHRGL